MSELIRDYAAIMAQNWTVWLVTVVLILAAVIDGFELRVPNWVTFPFVISGWIYSVIAGGLAEGSWSWAGAGEGLLWTLCGTVVGLVLLLIPYSIGGMGAGDVKLFAGVGAWMFAYTTAWAFAFTAIVGAVLAIAQVLISGQWKKHYNQFWFILFEILTVKNPEKLAAIAAERKPSMRLLPYGIPMAIGTILYFVWAGMLV